MMDDAASAASEWRRAKLVPAAETLAARLRWRLALDLLAWASLIWVAIVIGQVGLAGDAVSYYEARGDDLYGHVLGLPGYAYSPAFAQAIAPLQALPFETFRTVIAAAEIWGLAYLFGPILAFGMLLFQVPPIWEAILLSGNIQIFVAAMLVIALRHPAAWPVLLLTKVTPGVGLLWPVFKREWRNVLVAVGLTILIAGASFVVNPPLWLDWVAWLMSAVDTSPDRPGLPIWFRLAAAIAVVAYAARTDRVWLVPIAAGMASAGAGGYWLIALGAIPLWLGSQVGHSTKRQQPRGVGPHSTQQRERHATRATGPGGAQS